MTRFLQVALQGIAGLGLLCAMALLGTPGDAQADPVLTVSNGEFLNNSGPGTPGVNGSDAFNQVNPVGWSSGSSGPGGSLIFVTTTAAVNNGSVYLPVYGPTPGVQASATNPITNPIPGSNFVEADGNPYYGNSFSYQLSGLTVGTTYQLTFWEAFGQQTGFTGTVTSDEWVVGLGKSGSQFVFNESNPNLYSYTYSDAGGSVAVATPVTPVQEGFTGWSQVTVLLTADATNDVVTFLAWGNNGSTANVPPIAFLDIGANGNATPEPASLSLMAIGMLGFGAYARLRLRRSKSAKV